MKQLVTKLCLPLSAIFSTSDVILTFPDKKQEFIYNEHYDKGTGKESVINS